MTGNKLLMISQPWTLRLRVCARLRVSGICHNVTCTLLVFWLHETHHSVDICTWNLRASHQFIQQSLLVLPLGMQLPLLLLKHVQSPLLVALLLQQKQLLQLLLLSCLKRKQVCKRKSMLLMCVWLKGWILISSKDCTWPYSLISKKTLLIFILASHYSHHLSLYPCVGKYTRYLQVRPYSSGWDLCSPSGTDPSLAWCSPHQGCLSGYTLHSWDRSPR